MKKPANLELTPEAMHKMAEEAVRAVVDHIAALPKAPRSNLDVSEEFLRSLRESPPEQGTDFTSLLHFFTVRKHLA
jgi:hypothetical protein